MDWKSKLDAAKELGGKTRDSLTTDAEAKLEEHWPKVQQLFQEKVGPAALAAAQNDEAMRSLFKLVYDALPFPVRPMVKEETFVQFCFANRNRLLPSAQGAGA